MAVIPPLATVAFGAVQLTLELPGHGILAGNTATQPLAPSVWVSVTLSTAPRAPGNPRAIVRGALGASFPPSVRVSRIRGVAPANAMKPCAGGRYPTVTPRTLSPALANKRTD